MLEGGDYFQQATRPQQSAQSFFGFPFDWVWLNYFKGSTFHLNNSNATSNIQDFDIENGIITYPKGAFVSVITYILEFRNGKWKFVACCSSCDHVSDSY